MRPFFFLFLSSFATTIATSALQSETFYDRSAFSAATGPSITDSYDAPDYVQGDLPNFDPDQRAFSDAGMSAVLGETRYRATGGSDFAVSVVSDFFGEQFYCAGCNGSFALDFRHTSIGSGLGVYGVGFEYFNKGPNFFTAFVTYGDDGTVNIPIAPFSDNQPSKFFGLISDRLIASIALGLPDGAPTLLGNFAIDNLTIAARSSQTAPIPLPAAGWLLVAGIGALAATRHRARAMRST